ncbi:O-methyltransferase-domain-containing protein [Mycena leptocephala]|nr:O-methyltransferase-domain-containing protein [Mycena leptocephala]
MTLAVLRALHAILGDAIHDIETVYAHAQPEDPPPTHKTNSFSRAYASPPPSPSSSSSTNTSLFSGPGLDFPSLDAPYDPASPGEQLTAHPTVVAAINRIVAAAGQLAATVQVPFLTLCDAGMGYHLPSCLRLLEAAHVVEVLRDGPVHVREIAKRTGVEQAKLAHILRLLATHHILREAAPDVFAANRISSLIDSGKPLHALVANPERKYDGDASAVAAFVGLCTDELFKSSAYLTEAVFPGAARLYPAGSGSGLGSGSGSPASPAASLPSPLSASTGSSGSLSASTSSLNASTSLNTSTSTTSTNTSTSGADPTRAPFNYAFGCGGVGYFAWLEGEGWGGRGDANSNPNRGDTNPNLGDTNPNPNRFRLERFGKAMAGTGSWEALGAVLHGFDWAALPRGSVVVDVGGGIGSTSMLLASAYAEVDADGSGGLRFVIQDRPVVVEMGEKAWRAKCPELLDSGAVRFQVHDFFTPQPVTDASVFLLRVVLHDWPDAFAQRILLRLREAAAPHTRLVLADFVLPLACVDDFGVGEGRFSRVDLPSVAEARARFGPSVGVGRRPFGFGGASGSGLRGPPPPLKQAAVLTAPPARKKKPSPLSVVPLPSSPPPSLYRPVTSPGPQPPQPQSSPIARRMPPPLRPQTQQPLAPSPLPRQAPPPSPMSPRLPLTADAADAAPPDQHAPPLPSSPVLKQNQQHHSQPSPPLRHVPSSPVLKQNHHHQHHPQPSPPSPGPTRIPALTRRASHAQLQLPQTELRKRLGSIIRPAMNMIRKGLHAHYYKDDAMEIDHLDRCIDWIRQALMCAGDTSVVVWDPKQNKTTFQGDVAHTCRNFDKLRDWGKSHAIRTHYDTSVRIEDDIVIPVIPKQFNL